MKKVLVCGAGGFIGGHLVKFLKAKGYWVRGVDLKLNEFHDELNGNHNDIFIRQENIESYPRIYITFKSNPYFEKWKNEYNTRFVTTQIDMSPKSKRALFKLTSFWQTGGVISKVTTKQAWCEIR